MTILHKCIPVLLHTTLMFNTTDTTVTMLLNNLSNMLQYTTLSPMVAMLDTMLPTIPDDVGMMR
jgi:hypothetical protein